MNTHNKTLLKQLKYIHTNTNIHKYLIITNNKLTIKCLNIKVFFKLKKLNKNLNKRYLLNKFAKIYTKFKCPLIHYFFSTFLTP